MKQTKQNENAFSLSSLCKVLLEPAIENATRGSIKNGNNTLDSRVYVDTLHKNDNKVYETGRAIPSVLFHCLTQETIVAQSGRSMVEMLGALVIIGVLSVGAIGGYSYAIDRHKANQTINDIMLMGVDIINQNDRNTIPSLSEWGTKTTIGYDFEVIPNPENNSQYGIQITGVPSRVCKMVADGLQETVVVYVGNEDYTSDIETDPCDESNDSTMEFYFTIEENECRMDEDCGEGRYCDTDIGICFRSGKPEGPIPPLSCASGEDCGVCGGGCSNGKCAGIYTKHGDDCFTDTITNGMCYYGKCIAKGCMSNNDCTGKNEYCAGPSKGCREAPQMTKGVCVKADFTKLDVEGKTYYVSYNHMTWWDADAACRALGRDGLVAPSDIGNGWGEFTALGRALRNNLGTKYNVWTSKLQDSCYAYIVRLNNGVVVTGWRDNDYYVYGSDDFAVCRESF